MEILAGFQLYREPGVIIAKGCERYTLEHAFSWRYPLQANNFGSKCGSVLRANKQPV